MRLLFLTVYFSNKQTKIYTRSSPRVTPRTFALVMRRWSSLGDVQYKGVQYYYCTVPYTRGTTAGKTRYERPIRSPKIPSTRTAQQNEHPTGTKPSATPPSFSPLLSMIVYYPKTTGESPKDKTSPVPRPGWPCKSSLAPRALSTTVVLISAAYEYKSALETAVKNHAPPELLHRHTPPLKSHRQQ